MRGHVAAAVATAGLITLTWTACTQDDRRGPEQIAAPGEATPAIGGGGIRGAPPGYQTVTVSVPTPLRTPPFDVSRTLTIPTSYQISVIARVSGARFMAGTPDGRLLVTTPGSGRIMMVRRSGGSAVVSTFATGLRVPHDMLFATIGGTTYLYVAESHQVSRAVYVNGDLTIRPLQPVVINLPDGTTLPGYGHAYKNIAMDGNQMLYVSIASSCNVCLSDTQSNPVRGSIYLYNADGSGGRLFARGIRNAEGLGFVPGRGTLWVVVNNRDQIPYPFNDGSGKYGQVFPGYVDDHPPEEFIGVRDGGNYGWPFCNPNPDTPAGLNDMPFDNDYNMNANGSVDCNAMDRVTRGMQAHSAPLGLAMLQGTAIAPYYREGALVAFHGSWNRSVPTGAKVVYFTWDPVQQRPTAQHDFVSGWNTGAGYWGRPVDVLVDGTGAVLISDDASGTIYRMRQVAPIP